ncbi:MAG: E3 binding domain-containing protein [Acidimicrobiales bacterium]
MAEHRRDFLLPAEEGIDDGGVVILEWLVAVGERLTVNRPVCTVSGGGVARTLLSPCAGTVEALGGDVGDRLPPRALVIGVASPGGPEPEAEAEPEAEPPNGRGPEAEAEPPDGRGPEAEADPPGGPEPGGGRDADASPLARRLAGEYGVDLSTVEGTGAGGLVTRADVQRHVFGPEHGPPSTAEGDDAAGTGSATGPAPVPVAETTTEPTPAGDVGAIRTTGSATAIGAAATVPSYSVTVEVESGQLDRAGQRLGGAGGRPVSRAALLARLVVPALADGGGGPASVDGGPGAVGTGDLSVSSVDAHGAPFTAVVRAAHTLSLDEIHRALLAAPAPAGPAADDRPPPSVVIHDVGGLGLDALTPVLSPGASVIVTCGRTRPQVRLVDDRVATVPVATVVVTLDARTVAVEAGAAFVRRLVTYLEDPILAFAD